MPQTILLADDNSSVQNVFQEELQMKGYSVVVSRPGPPALQHAKMNEVDLILLEIGVPLAVGLRTYEDLRTHEETAGIPIIFLSRAASADVYPIVSKGRRVAYLKKPVDLEDLVSLIKQLLPS